MKLLSIENTINKSVERGSIRMFFKVSGVMADKIDFTEMTWTINRMFFGYNGKAELNKIAFTHSFFLDIPRVSFRSAKMIQFLLKDQDGCMYEDKVTITDKFERLR
jgi:hypothetical protein